tara:strand:- start:1167 stop:1799 length:633 start_codon:yes stop_codon:yes gene_type:complete
MKGKIIIIIMLLISLNLVSALDHFYEIDLEYNKGRLSYDSIKVKPLTIEDEISDEGGRYFSIITSFNNETLNLSVFDIPTTIFYDTIDSETDLINGGGTLELDQVNKTIKLPYYENAKEINIYNLNFSRVLSINVEEFSKNTCGDSICQSYESYQTCAKDCVLGKEEFKEEFIVEEEKKEEITTDFKLYLMIVLLIILLIIGYLVIKKEK